MTRSAVILAACRAGRGAKGGLSTIRRPIHGLVKVPTRGGLRHVKVAPRYLDIAVRIDADRSWALARAAPPPDLWGDQAALDEVVSRPDSSTPDTSRADTLDPAGVLVDALRSRGGRGRTTITLLQPGSDGSRGVRPSRLGLVLVGRASSATEAIAQLGVGHAEEARAALRALVLGALEPGTKPTSARDTPPWDMFDPDEYLAANYQTISPADEWLCQTLACDWKRAAERLGPGAAAIDVGTGPNIYTLLPSLRHVQSITAFEPSSSNRRYLARQRVALDSVWDAWIELLSRCDGRCVRAKVQRQLEHKLKISEQSIYALKPGSADAVTMFFCAECITRDTREFEMGCRAVIDAMRPGGSLMCAFMVGSTGYDTAGLTLPSVPVSEPDIRRIFGPNVEIVELTRVPGSTEVRAGHDGMLYLFGWRRERP